MGAKIKYRFSIVRFVPNQVRGEFVNIGIVLHILDTQELLSKWLPDLGRMRCLAPSLTIDKYRHFQHHLAERYNLGSSYSTVNSCVTNVNVGETVTVSKSSPELLDYLHWKWSIPFQFIEPVSGFTTNPYQQLEILYKNLVEPIEEEKE